MSATETATNVSKEDIGKAIGRIASGVYIATFGEGAERDGMLATWIAQCAFEPPMVSVAVKKERPILPKLAPGARLVVNVLGKKNMDIFKNFAKHFTDGMDRFQGLDVRQTTSGPAFANCIAYMECKVVSHAEAGDHILVLAEITGGAIQKTDDEPMVHLRNNGFQY